MMPKFYISRADIVAQREKQAKQFVAGIGLGDPDNPRNQRKPRNS